MEIICTVRQSLNLSNLVVLQPPKADERKHPVKAVPIIVLGSSRGNFPLFRDVRQSLENGLAAEVALVRPLIYRRGACGITVKAYSESIGTGRQAWAEPRK